MLGSFQFGPRWAEVRDERDDEKDTRGGGIGLQSVAASAEKSLSCRIADLGGNTAPCMGLASKIGAMLRFESA